jgi:isopenicillin N synthase-like dioxygenase
VVNHGIDAALIASVMEVGREFFRLPAEEKAKLYSDDPAKKIRLSTSFNVRKETVHNWRDYLRLHCYPLHQFVPDWPSNPPSFKYKFLFCLSSPTHLVTAFMLAIRHSVSVTAKTRLKLTAINLFLDHFYSLSSKI